MTTLARALSLPFALAGFALPAQDAPREHSPAFAFDTAWKEVVEEFRGGCERHGVIGASLMLVRGRVILGFDAFGLADRSAGRLFISPPMSV